MHLVLRGSHSLTAHHRTSKQAPHKNSLNFDQWKEGIRSLKHPCPPGISASSMNINTLSRNKTPYCKGDMSPCQMFHPQRSYAYDNPALGLGMTEPKKVWRGTWKTSVFHMFPFQTPFKGKDMKAMPKRHHFSFRHLSSLWFFSSTTSNN